MKKKWYIVTQSAEDSSITYVHLTDDQYKTIANVLEEVENNSSKYCGRTTISKEGYESLIEAQKHA